MLRYFVPPNRPLIAQLKDESLFIQKGYIGGEFLDAKNGKTFPVYGML